ncbi:Type-1 restriction enzyme EcoKI specificity protein [Clostridium ljungdahlii]|uniref:Type-1 restriction enzyme EcoKI specificity protein n=1 Tax=Clostridium ljungdahlii TaxID=1538 RepID=A0A168PIW6_9CLOT|nr:Type-1 restriction enzyme EcoKI specificity protein [Clostridium ljungdahlii]
MAVKKVRAGLDSDKKEQITENNENEVKNEKLRCRSGYKMTELGEVPEEWEIRKFGDVLSFMKSGLSRNLKEEDVGIPCIRSNNMVNGKIDKADLKYWFLKDDKGANIDDYVLDDGDILVNFINSIAQIGKTCIYRNIGRKSIYTTNIFRIKVNTQLVDNKFFYYYTQTNKYNMDIGLITKPAVNQASFTSVDFKNIIIPIPSIKEQQKISLIISSVDEQIEISDNLIEKTKKLKKGLMQKLFTKGIGHSRFKNTEIGRIPEEWSSECSFINIKSGFGFKLNEYVENGIPLIRINNVMYGKITDEDLCFLPQTYLEEYKEFVLKKGDILVALNRPVTNNQLKIGKVVNEPAILYQRVGRLEMDLEKYNPNFYFQYLQSDYFINILTSSLVGSDQPYIKTSEFSKIYFPVPTFEEQQKISSILSSVDEQIDQYEAKKEKLQELKKGLMQKLLTGKIRVKVC